LRKAPRLAPLITAIGVSIVLQNLAMIIWGRDTSRFRRCFHNQPHDIPRRHDHRLQIGIDPAGRADDGGLIVVVQKTRLGRAMRATAQNPAGGRADGRQHQSGHR
jgi:branched-chain amino acid transport system permease protein